ncbi:unnamed protein product [Sphagnum jensenii]|uniref:Uncharacterized protein n=1 Tax=Sphagnum jensenii TaxID=128206 RepID=A0ABP1BSD1_9BRYO
MTHLCIPLISNWSYIDSCTNTVKVWTPEGTPFHFDSALDDSKHCIRARQGKKVTTGSKAAAQQDCISALPQQVYLPVPCSDVHTDSSENMSKADRDKDAENSVKENVYGVSWFQEDRIQGTWL